MGVDNRQDVSQLLAAWSEGDQQALNELVSAVYPEIRKIARQRLRQAPQQTLESAAVANEAYVRLFQARGIQCENRLMFFALCAQVIRRIIGEYARSRRYSKRGGSAVRVPLDEQVVGANGHDIQLLALDQALDSLCKMDPRKSRLVELHCFGGLTMDESAEVLGISPETAKRDWKLAKAWLGLELAGRRPV
ncbi:MAG TPA: ECF-type sigma factor [Bryobacteraceae bacterium]|nr:ECF-type sigma factor [Bryobacteraceae bacterium]